MKKGLKYVFLALGTLGIVLLLGAAYIQISGIPSYEVKKINYKASITPESVARGKKLALVLCANCHLNTETGQLTGRQMKDAPLEFGKIYSQNITQDKNYGIGSWTDGELLYLLRTGIKRDGKYAPPYMAKLPHMADEDINAIIAFLHSDDPMVVATNVADTPCEPSFLTKFLCHVAFKPMKMPEQKIEMPDTLQPVVLGKYLATNLECFSCHSADFKTNDFENPEKSEGYFGGGNQPLNLEGKVMLTPNLTPDKETGIGNWTEAQFVNALKSGLVENQPALRYPMLPYVHLTDQEAKAIFAYLKTISPIKHKVVRSALN